MYLACFIALARWFWTLASIGENFAISTHGLSSHRHWYYLVLLYINHFAKTVPY